MGALNVVGLYNKTNEKTLNSFSKDINSSLRVVTDFDKVECDYSWIDLMEETIPYIDNILRSPNRFIVNEEDVIKVELAKKITVESIKHLSKNTNLIEDYNTKTGDVRPSKILNITKEESYNTYENRLIYSLIQNMKLFIEMRKQDLIAETSEKNDKSFEYNATSAVGNEKIDISMNINSKYSKKHKEKNDEGMTLDQRLEKLNNNIAMLTNSEVYKLIDKLHLSLIVPPVKKTNLIRKNVNFQYAMKLWDYLHETHESSTTRKKDKKDFMDSGEFKSMVDETFMLNYLIMDSINKKEEEITKEEKAAVQEKIVGNMVNQVMKVNHNISEKQLKDIVGEQFTIIKYKHVTSDKEIKDIFKKHIDMYMKKISQFRI